MNLIGYDLLLADDDIDDCMFFKEALEDLPLSTSLSTVNDGVELMNFLSGITGKLPDVLFLDLNMPKKTGIECLTEIKQNASLRNMPVVIFSTSLDMDVVNDLYESGAHYYIRKPGDFSKLKNSILEALIHTGQKDRKKPSRDKFILHV